jgi:glycolate oxidase FAD binding subunit
MHSFDSPSLPLDAPRSAIIAHVQSQLGQTNKPLLPRGSGTKRPLSFTDNAIAINTLPLDGILDYQPSEFTITCLAGTKLRTIEDELSEHGQYLPFDPPLVDAGATIGGTIAAGLSGPSRCRHGGVRDFVLGVQFIDGQGQIVRGGGRVVKNSAGFDLPKLLTGSCGGLGIILELTLKVFPKPTEYQTLLATTGDLKRAIALVDRLARSPVELEAIDFTAEGNVLIRISGTAARVDASLDRFRDALPHRCERIGDGAEERSRWNNARDGQWTDRESDWIARVPCTLGMVEAIADDLHRANLQSRFSVAGSIVHVAPRVDNAIESFHQLDRILRSHRLHGIVWKGKTSLPTCRLGHWHQPSLETRIASAIDPHQRFYRHATQDS